MGVYVKGIEMPETCIECINSGLRTAIRCSEWTKISAGLRENHRALSCPLVEVPKPHGDLIEAPDVSEYEVFDEDTGTREISLLGLMECHRMVENAKTVIEAEDEK